ncbi:hypothetical protein [uncultured Devosia sp.]|uniref:hypothetical protein n=1 Tax=uncultured Devosia sp. TaxID=211434 RepID=UPI0035CA6970
MTLSPIRLHAERAFDIVRPAIVATMASGVTGRQDLAVVITAIPAINPVPDGMSFEDGCLLVAEIGNLANSSYPNRQIALKKAERSMRTGQPTAHLSPSSLLPGDSVFWGSAVLDGIVVACAGLDEYHDEMFSYWIAATVNAVAKQWFEEQRHSRPDDSFV